MPATVDPAFFDYLKNVNLNDVTIYAMQEGSVTFPRLLLII